MPAAAINRMGHNGCAIGPAAVDWRAGVEAAADERRRRVTSQRSRSTVRRRRAVTRMKKRASCLRYHRRAGQPYTSGPVTPP